jgi:hypothetical protein
VAAAAAVDTVAAAAAEGVQQQHAGVGAGSLRQVDITAVFRQERKGGRGAAKKATGGDANAGDAHGVPPVARGLMASSS